WLFVGVGRSFMVVMFGLDVWECRGRQAVSGGMVRAIVRSEAVIVFDLTGYVLPACRIFLAVFGYDLVLVVGYEHRMFCSDDFVSSLEY
ncbi:chemotaxis protein, partial [Pseudomonas syringae pv. tagetis]